MLKDWPHGVASADTRFGGSAEAFAAEAGNDSLPTIDPADLDEMRKQLDPEEIALLDEIAAL